MDGVPQSFFPGQSAPLPSSPSCNKIVLGSDPLPFQNALSYIQNKEKYIYIHIYIYKYINTAITVDRESTYRYQFSFTSKSDGPILNNMPNKYTFDDDSNYTSNTAKYAFKETSKPTLKDRLSLRGKKSRRTNSFGSNKSTSSRSSLGTNNDDDGTGSLTYSATSSVASESSFNNIVKVLQQDGHDSKEIAALLKNRGIVHHHHRNVSNGDEKSCAADSLAYSARSATSDSLAYSEEAESYMRMLAADGESTAHVSQVSLLQGTALLSNGYENIHRLRILFPAHLDSHSPSFSLFYLVQTK